MGWLRNRVHHRGLHGAAHIDRERAFALLMILTGLGRVVIWGSIALAYAFHAPLIVGWFRSVAFVSLLSILALLLTDWGQVAASFAQFTAAHAHHDAEEARKEIAR